MVIKVNQGTAIIFDLDDTLYNEIEFLKSAFREIAGGLEGENWKPLYAKMVSLYRCGKDVFAHLAETYRMEKSPLIKAYREHQPGIEPFEGVQPLLKAIKGHQGKTGIITNGRTLTQMNKIEALGIRGFFDKIVISEAVGVEKPDPGIFEVLARELRADSYWYIADNLSKDFVSPNQMGWLTIGLIDNGLNIHKNGFEFMEERFMPNTFITDLSEIRIVP